MPASVPISAIALSHNPRWPMASLNTSAAGAGADAKTPAIAASTRVSFPIGATLTTIPPDISQSSPHRVRVRSPAGRDLHHAVLDRRAVDPQRLPHRIALGIGEAFDAGAVRNRGDQVLCDLRFLVVRH